MSANRMPVTPTMRNNARQPHAALIQNNTGLRKARPKYCPIEYTPVARARSCCGNQVLRTRLLQGKAGASATPRARRALRSEARPEESPCRVVQTDHSAIDRKYVSLTPMRSSRIPPGIWDTAYVHE